jgi:hypothetical protein
MNEDFDIHQKKTIIVNKWRPFTMLVNARLSYISVDGLHYNPGGQVILTVNPLALLHL